MGQAAHTGLEKEAVLAGKVSPEFSNVNQNYLTRHIPLTVSSKMGMDCGKIRFGLKLENFNVPAPDFELLFASYDTPTSRIGKTSRIR